ncbi:MAG: bifunctional UDP-N-acetylmuramoyl-tripeptide:D-alanyl-D-alanine ligase/alanine racemase [Flavobacteriales bacterium]|nr:MAG: bifunctional UDP-N-acetylmuramoyl-tripeptide:D-alanyl-D-alanine ligase/alanine racemase [Flavobacteriales bacterium]
MKYTVKYLAEITNSQMIGDEDLVVENINFDTRTIFSSKNQAFIAINTTTNSGENYIEEAVNKGIKIIISENKTLVKDDITWIIVENSVSFLQKVAKFHLSQFPIQTIGITGSNGKTVIKEWLYQCLNEKFSLVKSPKSFNSQIGLPLSILETNETHELGIFEVGISQPDEMQKQADIFSPKIGILTHIGSAHLSNFNSTKKLVEEKIKLFKNSEIIIYNNVSPIVKNSIEKTYPHKKLISYGLSSENDIYINKDWQNRSKDISIYLNKTHFEIPVQARDEATLNNVLAVIGVLDYFGFTHQKMIEKINQLKSVEMRLESVEGINNNLIINDSFNLDEDSLVIAFQRIKEYNKKNKVLFLTDFTERKCSKKDFYRHIADLTNQQNFDKIFLIGEEITNYAQYFTTKTFTFNNTKQLIDHQNLKEIKNAIILLKGARVFQIEKLKAILAFQKHDTVLEVNLNALLHNLNIHKNLLAPKTKIMAMVKAFSYGLGGYEIAEFLEHHHIDYLGVAYADEGVSLRKKGITTPIIVMNPEQSSYSSIIDYNLEPEIYNFRMLKRFHQALKNKGINKKYPIHIKLETGMHRLGFKEDELTELKNNLNIMGVKVKSIFSHLSSADIKEEKDYTLQQLKTFDKLSTALTKSLGYRPIRHILNSAGIVNFTDYQFDMVRIGIGLIGISVNKEIENQLQSVVKFKTVISQISEIKKGESIGYARKYIADKNTTIATLPVGYADGISRLLGNENGLVKIQGKKIPIIGNVCMDMMMVDLKNHIANEGDEVILFDTIEDLKTFAEKSQTIVYEILTSISRRVKRIYIKL